MTMHVVKASPADRRPWRFGYLVLLMAFAISLVAPDIRLKRDSYIV